MTTARRESATDTCRLIVGLVQAAAGANKTAIARGNQYLIRSSPLHTDNLNTGCKVYANKVVK